MSDCLYPDLDRTGYVHGCRCDRHRRLNTLYSSARQRERRSNAAVRELGGGHPRGLAPNDAIVGVNALDAWPLLRHGERTGQLVNPHSPAYLEVADRMGLRGAALQKRLRVARERGWISEKHVDELCVAMRTHPALVYGEDWYGLVCQDATLDELADVGLVPAPEQEAA